MTLLILSMSGLPIKIMTIVAPALCIEIDYLWNGSAKKGGIYADLV